MSGGGGGGPSTSTVNQNNVPSWMQPYAMQMLGGANSLVFGQSGQYQPYTGQQVAGFSPLQTQGFQNIQGMQPSSQIGQATGMTGIAGLKSGQIANQNNDFYNNQVGNYTGANVNQYMSPYMNDVVNQQKMAAGQDYARSLPNQNAAASAAGALGGTRGDIVQSQGQRNLQQQLQGIQATGSQAAFQNAQQQFNQQQMMNMQNANQAAQWGAMGQQIGLQGLGQEMQAGSQLGQLGSEQYQQQMGINSALMNAGQQQQQQQQQLLNVPYQNYLEARQYPYTQMEFLNSLVHGFAPNTQTTVYPGQPNVMGQALGLAGGIAGLSNAWGSS